MTTAKAKTSKAKPEFDPLTNHAIPNHATPLSRAWLGTAIARFYFPVPLKTT